MIQIGNFKLEDKKHNYCPEKILTFSSELKMFLKIEQHF